MEFLQELPNVDTVFKGTVEELLTATPVGSIGTCVALSHDWFTWDSPDYSHFDAYDAAFDLAAEKINAALGETATRQQGFDDDTFEPVPLLEAHEIYADFFYHWPKHNLFLVTAHEDKELPIDIALLRIN